MKTRQLLVSVMLAFFMTSLISISLTGCNKTPGQEVAEKKAKEDFRKGTFKPSPRKGY